jgi:hypothetical protein
VSLDEAIGRRERERNREIWRYKETNKRQWRQIN